MAQYEAGEWPVDYSMVDVELFDMPNASSLQYVCEEAAVNLLWNWTNHVFGSTEVSIRPQLQDNRTRPNTWEGRGPKQMYPFNGSRWRPLMINGHLYSLRCGCDQVDCTCNPGEQWALKLPGGAQEVIEVEIENSVLIPDVDYRLENNSLIKTSGYWPIFQNLRLELGNTETWGVTYVKGLPVPKGGQLAAGVLAYELAKALIKDATCRLPVRLQLLVNNGSQEQLKDTYGAYLSFGKTGLWIIDSWVDSVLVNRATVSVRSVDLPSLR